VKAMANLDDLLEKTSRTFALSIPMLPEPTRRHVSIAYLLFRVADTFEDASLWPRARRLAASTIWPGTSKRAAAKRRRPSAGWPTPPLLTRDTSNCYAKRPR